MNYFEQKLKEVIEKEIKDKGAIIDNDNDNSYLRNMFNTYFKNIDAFAEEQGIEDWLEVFLDIISDYKKIVLDGGLIFYYESPEELGKYLDYYWESY